MLRRQSGGASERDFELVWPLGGFEFERGATSSLARVLSHAMASGLFLGHSLHMVALEKGHQAWPAKGLLVNKLIFLRLVITSISVSRILVIAHYDCESAP